MENVCGCLCFSGQGLVRDSEIENSCLVDSCDMSLMYTWGQSLPVKPVNVNSMLLILRW